jgi:molybdopterin synthase catalytic subunit
MMTVRVQGEPFDPWREIAAHQADAGWAGRHGAAAVFVGSLRDFNQGQAVSAMRLEHYPGMTERELERLCAEAGRRWDILDVLVIHRHGELRPNEPIVLAAVWAVHREPAFAACRFLIEELKTRAPFWKQEQTAAGRRWVRPG